MRGTTNTTVFLCIIALQNLRCKLQGIAIPSDTYFCKAYDNALKYESGELRGDRRGRVGGSVTAVVEKGCV